MFLSVYAKRVKRHTSEFLYENDTINICACKDVSQNKSKVYKLCIVIMFYVCYNNINFTVRESKKCTTPIFQSKILIMIYPKNL